LAGSFAILIGLFLPLISAPYVYRWTYLEFDHRNAIVLAILALVSLVLVLLRKYKMLWLTGIVSLGVITFTALDILYDYYEINKEFVDSINDLKGNPFAVGLESMVVWPTYHWGWLVLFGGAILFMLSAAMRPKMAAQGAPAVPSQYTLK